MASIGEFNLGEEVFIFHAGEWMGVEIVGGDLESSLIYTKLLWTNGVPGYVAGDSIVLDDGVAAYRVLTVDRAANP